MQVYLLRHGIAEDQHAGKSDAQRRLTPRGVRRLKDVLKQASSYETVPSLVLSSPLVRAFETAEIAASELGYKNDILQTTALTPESSPAQVWEEIRIHRGESAILLVGHEPLFSSLYSFLLDSPSLAVRVRKGSLGRIELDASSPRARGILHWILVPSSE